MNCAISETQQRKLRKKIAGNLDRIATSAEPFDLNDYVQSIYDMIKASTNDHEKAVDYARLTPFFIDQIISTDLELQRGLRNAGLDRNALSDLVLDATNEETGVQAIENYLTTESSIQEELEGLNSVVTEEETEEVEEEEQPVTPTPVTRGGRVGRFLRSVFRAAPATAWADRIQEALSYVEDDPNYNVPDPKQKFYFDVKRKLIQELAGVDYDSSEMDYHGMGPVYLTAVSVSQIDAADLGPDMAADVARFDPQQKGVLLVLTNQYGEPIRFDNDATPTLDSSGKIAYYSLRATEGLFNDNGSVNLKPEDTNAIKSLARTRNLDFDTAREVYIKELKAIDDIRKHVSGTTNTVRNKIDGGSMGYIPVSSDYRGRLSSVNFDGHIFKPENVTLAGQRDNLSPGTTFFDLEDMYGEAVIIERPRVADETDLTDTIVSLIVDDLVDSQGNPIDYNTRKNYIENYVYKNDKRLQINVERGDNTKRYMFIDGTKFKLNTPAEQQQAREALTDYFTNLRPDLLKTEAQLSQNQRKLPIGSDPRTGRLNDAMPVTNEDGTQALNENGEKLYRILDKAKLHINKSNFGTNFPAVTIEDGVLTTEAKDYNDFLKENFFVHTKLNADQKIMRLNAYFTFQPLQEDLDDIYGREQVDALPERMEEEPSPTPENGLEDSAPGNGESLNDLMDDSFDDPLLNKNRDQQDKSLAATKQQIKEAKVWYENSPLSKHIPFEEMFHLVNSQDLNSIATWGMHGITLYKGADFSDLYHEAWHAFTQGFMTIEQKKELYGEARKKTGSFRDYEGKRVQFSRASDKQLEEYMAEDFRSYMLNGQKTKANSPKRNSFFQKIYNFFKALFDNSSVTEVMANDKADAGIHALYEKLRVGDLSEYTFSQENVQFGALNKGMQAWNTDESVKALSYQQSKKLTDTVDSLFSQYGDWMNAGLNDQETIEYGELTDVVNDPNATLANKRIATNRLKVLDEKRSYKFSSGAIKSPKQLKNAYKFARIRLGQLYEAKKKQLAEETNESAKALIQKDMETLYWAFQNFGNVNNIAENMSQENENVKGVIGYHMMKSEKFFDERTLQDIMEEDMSEEDTFLNGRQGHDRKGNENSMKDLASKEILYLIHGLNKTNKAGKIEMNSFGVPELVNFQEVWNRLARTLENTLEASVMEQKLKAEAKNYPPFQQLLDRMGPLATGSKSENQLWTNFWQTFNKSRVKLMMMTLDESTNNDGVKSYLSKIGEAFNTRSKIGRGWDSDFKTASPRSSKYLKKDREGNYLNIGAVLDDFKEFGDNIPQNKQLKGRELEFFHAIGVKLTDTEEMRDELAASDTPSFILSRMKYLMGRGETVRSLNDIFKAYTKSKVNERSGREYRPQGDFNSRFTGLTNLEAKYSDSVSNYMVTNAEGNTQFEHTLNNSMTVMVNAINASKNYFELVDNPHMSHLNIERNPFAAASTWMNSLYVLDQAKLGTPEYGTKRTVGNTNRPVEMSLTNLSGVLINQEEGGNSQDGVASAKADEYTKFILDLHLVTQIGIPELMRHSDKGTSYSIAINKINRTEGSKKSGIDRQYILNQDFIGDTYHNVAYSMIMPHIAAELERIQTMRDLQAKVDRGEDIGPMDYDYLNQGQNFVQFDDVLRQGTKEALIQLASEGVTNFREYFKSPDGANIETMLRADLRNYFSKQVEKVDKRFAQAEFVADSVIKKTRGEARNTNQELTVSEAKDVLVKSFVYNSWIHNLESMSIIYGDLALYDHTKEAFHKRNAGMGSTGNLYRTDSVFQKYANTTLGRGYARSIGVEEKAYDGTFDTAVVQDNEIGSVYYEEYVQALVDTGMSKEDAERTLKPYAEGGMNEGDAQGWITFDAYRLMKEAEGNWSPTQEKLYQDIIDGKTIDPALVTQFFPTVKAQYFGPLKTNGLPVTAFHKYSLFPMIPTVIAGTNLEKLHNKMVREGVDYSTFVSGSKVSTITKDGNLDPLYADNKRTIADVPFTKNTIFMNYLKDQLEIAPKAKGSVIFSTQLRKLIEDGLYEEGKALNDKFRALVEDYENNIKRLTELKKDDLLKEANWTREYDADGNEVLKGDMADLLKFVKRELSRQDLADHEVNFIELGDHGGPKHDLSLSLSSEKIEKLLNSIVTKRLVKQKVKGEGLIQVSGAMFESMESTYDRDYTNPTDEQRDKYGSNDLPTYHKGADGNTKAMKVKVAMQGDFLNLLDLDYNGERIDNIANLNKALKDEAWLNEGNNRAMVTMVGVRIPVQGLNSMEFMEIYEFLPAEAGSIIVPPAEIVAKSGADYDIDKMTVMMPNITKRVNRAKLTNQLLNRLNESYPNLDFSRDNVNILLDAMRDDSGVYSLTEEDKQMIEIINDLAETEIVYSTEDTEKGIQNRLITNIKSILELPENYASLIRPNGTDILQPIAEDLQEDVQEYNPLDVIDGDTRTFVKRGEVKNMISPTRVFEIEYNLYKHTSNNLGKQTLGLGAVDNTYNSVFNRIGARMNATAGTSTKEYNRLVEKMERVGKNKMTSAEKRKIRTYHRQKLFLKHNTIEVDNEKAISLSQLMDASGEHRVSDVINQMINGWVDIAADTWIFNVQGNKEVSPTLLFMIQAGVPVKQAIYFASMPLVRQYVKEQRLAKSTFAGPLGKAPVAANLFRQKARAAVLGNPANAFNISAEDLDGKKINSTINAQAITQIENFLGAEGEFDQQDMRDGIKDYSTKTKAGEAYTTTDLDRAAFLHFLEVENMAKSVAAVKMNLNFDTTKSGTLFEAQNAILMKEGLRQDARIPEEIVDKVLSDSPISSFYIQPFQLKIWNDLFKLRTNEVLNDFLMEKIQTSSKDIDNTFGKAEIFANEFKNDLINFMFQNAIKDFSLNRDSYRGRITDATLPASIRETAELTSLKFGAFVVDGVLYVDKARIRKDYLNRAYKNAEYAERGLARVSPSAFQSVDDYAHFVYEREHLRSLTPFSAVSETKVFAQVRDRVKAFTGKNAGESTADYTTRLDKLTYEVYLKDTALDNTYNYWKMFKSQTSYAAQFNELKADYPELENEFDLVAQLSTGLGKNQMQNLKLNDMFADADSLNLFHENLRDLMKGNFESVKDAEGRQRIIEFFGRFPNVAFMQSGLNTKSAFSMIRLVPQDIYLRIMAKPTKELTQHLDLFTQEQYKNQTSPYLEEYYQNFVALNGIQNAQMRNRGKDYLTSFTVDQANRMVKEGKNKAQVTERARFYDPLVSLGTNLKGYSTLNMSIGNVQDVVENNPEKVFIYNHALDNQANAVRRDQALYSTGAPNILGLPTRLAYAGGANVEHMRDLDGAIDPRVKESIDDAIDAMKEIQASGSELYFSKEGYGQYMIGSDEVFNEITPEEYKQLSKNIDPKNLEQRVEQVRVKDADGNFMRDANNRWITQEETKYYALRPGHSSRFVAPQTFVYLSKRLFEEFGYINPNYLSTNTGRTTVQSTQPISDQQIRDFMNHCI